MSKEMDLLKHAIATGGNYTEIMQMEQQQAITAQEQSEGMLSSDQNTTMTFPKSSGDFHTQGMKFNLDISKFDNTGNLVKSYENTPPGIQNLSMGTGEGTVIETPSQYKKGGFEDPEDEEVIQGGMLPEVEISALTDESYNKLSQPQKQVYDTFVTSKGIAQTVDLDPSGDRTMHWKNALQMVEDTGVKNIYNEPTGIKGKLFQKLFARYPDRLQVSADPIFKNITVEGHDKFQSTFMNSAIKTLKNNRANWVRELTDEEREAKIRRFEDIQENADRRGYFGNVIAELAHLPEFWRWETLKNLPVSFAKDAYRFIKGEETDHSRYHDKDHYEYKTHTGPNNFEEQLKSKYELKQKGGFEKYQSKGFTIIRKEGDEHVRDVDISSVNFDLLYNAIEQHEHRGVIDEKDYDSFIRTNATGSGSSAYGPIQLTRDKLLDLTTPGKRAYYDVENVDPTFHSAIIQQGDAMLEFGGSDMPEGGITEDGEDVSMFDYGQAGVIGNTTRDREKYKRMGIQILEGDYRFAVKNPKKDVNTLHQMLKAYGTGTNKYAKDVLKIYNELLEEESNTFKLENILKSKTK